MAAQGGASPAPQKVTRRGWGCLAVVGLIIIVIIIGAASGGSKSSSSGGSSAQKEASEYIAQKSHVINYGRVDYEHVELLVGLAAKSGSEIGTVTDELAKVAQEAHNQIDGFRNELVNTGGNEKFNLATATLSEGANELKNAMGAIVAYTGNPNPATLAQVSTQLEAAKSKWNEGVDEIWTMAGEHGAYRLK
jgi:hypothetical protein